ncbi:hypothetical protein KSP40_PGU003107 [Platanthera guangdongensis]|uniref:Miro domain-containing protein n=1 Tax=Platanthera guangdongensis TaxID=2320717 RepID=A0ABR2M8W5_9ASPA
MAASSSPTNLVGLSGVRIVVVGDVGTGKSILIVAVATESFSENVPSVLPPTRPPVYYYPDRIPLTIIDTSSSKATLMAEFQSADVVVLTYACDRPALLDRLSSYWLPELRRLEVKVPVIMSVAASIDCDATSGDEDDDDGTSDGDMSSLDNDEEDDSNTSNCKVLFPQSIILDLLLIFRYMAPPVLYSPYGGYLVPQVALPSPAPVLAPSVYASVQVNDIFFPVVFGKTAS